MPGVVSLPHGWGHAREGSALSVARAHPGASLNDLTDEQAVDSLSGNAAFSGLPVSVSLVGPPGADWELLQAGTELQAGLGTFAPSA